MSIIQRVPWTVQPQVGVGVDDYNPLAKNLLFVWHGQRPGTYLRAPITTTSTITGNGLTSTLGPNGLGAKTPGRYDGRNFYMKVAVPPPFTALAVYSDSTSRNLERTPFSGDNSNAAIGNAFQHRVTTGSSVTFLGYNTTPTAFTSTAPGITKSVSLNISGGTVDAAGIVTAYLNGAAGSPVTITGTPQGISASAADGIMTVGNRPLFGIFDGGFFSPIYLCLLWNRALSAGEIKSLSDNPWQLFAPQTRRLWVPVSASGAYTVTADAASFALTGQDATLLKTRIVTADAAAFTVAAQDASLLRGRVVTADAAAYAFAGQDATLTYAIPGVYTIACDPAAYAFAGQDATLTYVGNSLISRKYPRRGRSRARKVIEIPEDIPAVIEKITLEKAELSEELAAAQADLVSVRMLSDNVVNRSKQIAKLTSAINELEHNINVRREEEVLLLLSLMVME